MALEDLLPCTKLPTVPQQLERAMRRAKAKESESIASFDSVSAYGLTPYRHDRDESRKAWGQEVNAMNAGDRAAFGIALKLLRVAMGRYKNNLPPVAERSLAGGKLYGLTQQEFEVRIHHWVVKLTHEKSLVHLSISQGIVELYILHGREPEIKQLNSSDHSGRRWKLTPI